MATVTKTRRKTTKQTSESGPTRAEKTAALRQRITDSIDTLADAVDRVRASAAFVAYLKTQARFHRYSWTNSMLIMQQSPEATRVAGYRTWQKLKRFVKKGERGIMIIAPCPWTREKDNATGETETESGMFFRAVHVFDVAQTDGDDLPTVDVPDVAATADRLLADLSRVTDDRGIALAFETIESGAYGVSAKGSIRIDNTHGTGQQAKTLAHELAHEALHWEDRGELTRAIAELEAESVAYVVCQHFGLDTSVRSSMYVAVWDGNAQAIRESLARIADTARAIIDDIEGGGGMKGKRYIAIDQHGRSHTLKTAHPRKELLERFGYKTARRMFCDVYMNAEKTKTATRHIGWIIGALWFEVFELSPLENGGAV